MGSLIVRLYTMSSTGSGLTTPVLDKNSGNLGGLKNKTALYSAYLKKGLFALSSCN